MMYAKELIQHKQMSDYTEIMTRYTRYFGTENISYMPKNYPIESAFS